MDCHLKFNVIKKNGMSLKKKMSLKIECYSKWNVTQNGMSLKLKCQSKLNVTQNGMSLKIECHSK